MTIILEVEDKKNNKSNKGIMIHDTSILFLKIH